MRPASRHLAAFALFAALCFVALYRSQANGAPTSSAESPRVVLALTGPTEDVTTVTDGRRTWGTISHLPGATVKGALLPDGRSAALVAEVSPTLDRSWNSELVLLRDDGSLRVLAGQVYASTRPFVTRSGELVVTRGVAGADPQSEKGVSTPLRMDAMTVEAISPSSGEARVVWRTTGYLSFIAGIAGNEVLVYDIGPGATPLRAIDLSTLKARVLVADLSLARDFRVATDGRWMTFTQHAADSVGDWKVVRLDLSTGERRDVAQEPTIALFPAPLGAQIAFNPYDSAGLQLDDGKTLPCPFGVGADELLVTSRDGRWAAGLHTVPSELSSPFLLDLRSRTLTPVPLPPGKRADVLGVLP